MRPGRAYLVGAGPGDPGLITRRGLELLRSSEVVLYDRLVAPALLEEAPAAEKIFVGKTPDSPSMTQAEIDALVVDRARAGKKVVRLKGGDPYVFGRGADEAQALVAAGIPFEVVPGVTSAVAVPSYAGIAVTHSGMSSSFTVMTAHESSMRPDARARWDQLATGADTLVLLMGVGSIRDTTRRLAQAGRRTEEPCAVIEWGTTARQRVVVGRLDDIADLVEEAEVKPPATTIVGEVVRLRPALDWLATRPLLGTRIVVTRARTYSGKLPAALEELGAEVIHLPTIEIQDPPSWSDVDAAVAELAAGAFEWVIFSSVHGVERLFERLRHAGMDARAFGTTKVAAVGTSTAAILHGRGIEADLVPEKYTGEALARALGSGSGRVLLPRPASAPNEIIDLLSRAGWKPHEAVAYSNVPAPRDTEAAARVEEGSFDVVTFTSASTARNFVDMMGHPEKLGLSGHEAPERVVACIGPVTADAARRCGLRVDVVAEPHTVDGLVDALLDRLGLA